MSLAAPPTFFTSIPKLSEAEAKAEAKVEADVVPRRYKTMRVGIMLCLNVGAPPADADKPSEPCATKECWIDPTMMSPQEAVEAVGSRLKQQYLALDPQVKCRQATDPTWKDLEHFCAKLHNYTKETLAVFHYNGHGVPKPTDCGEIWVCNADRTHQSRISLDTLRRWIRGPTMFVFDCARADVIVDYFARFTETDEGTVAPREDFFQFGACRGDEELPTHPSLPADLFTSCLTTPVRTALLWALVTGRSAVLPGVTLDMLERIPGASSDRHTMLGHLIWVLDAVTDSIAWSAVPSPLFIRLFRSDRLASALPRNFILADRVMRTFSCTPVASFHLPPTQDHPLWQAWDRVVDHCLAQLPEILAGRVEFEPSTFFPEHLSAFEVGLDMHPHDSLSPAQLPVLFHALLVKEPQQQRLRALKLLDRFMSLSADATRRAQTLDLTFCVGMLLGSKDVELRPVLVSIWAKLLVVHPRLKQDLLESSASLAERPFLFFIKTLLDAEANPDTRAKAAFVLAVFCHDYPRGQGLCVRAGLVAGCLQLLTSAYTPLRQWAALAIAKACYNLDAGRATALTLNAPASLLALLDDPAQEVRAAAVHALSSLVGLRGTSTLSPSDLHTNVELIAVPLLRAVDDGCHAVRAEAAAALGPVAVLYRVQLMDANARLQAGSSAADHFCQVLKVLSELTRDPYPAVSTAAQAVLQLVGIAPFPSQCDRRPAAGGSGAAAAAAAAAVPTLSPTSRRSSAMPTEDTVPEQMDISPKSATGPSPDGSPASPSVTMLQDETLVLSKTELLAQMLIADIARIVEHLELKEQAPLSAELKKEIRMGLCDRVERVRELCSEARCALKSWTWKATMDTDVLHPSCLEELVDSLRFFAPSKYDREVHAVTTVFFAWCCEVACGWTAAAAAHSSALAEQRTLRQVRDAAVYGELAEAEGKGKELRLEQPVFQASIPEVADVLAFHSYEPHLVMANAHTGNISVWSTERAGSICSFASGTRGARVTSLNLINEHEAAMLAVGSSDGVVQLWQDYSTTPTLLTSWRAVSIEQESRDGVGAGLVCDWDQRTGRLLACRDTGFIHIWDAATALRCSRIATGVDSCVTAISVDKTHSSLFAVGFGNGILQLHDIRIAPEQSTVQRSHHHTSWVVNVRIDPTGMHGLVSGSRAGDLLLWDQRFLGSPVRSVEAYSLKRDKMMTSFAVHDHADLMATAAMNHPIKIFNRNGDILNQHADDTPFLGVPIGPTSSLAFHPLRPMLAAGSFEKVVTIFAQGKRKERVGEGGQACAVPMMMNSDDTKRVKLDT